LFPPWITKSTIANFKTFGCFSKAALLQKSQLGCIFLVRRMIQYYLGLVLVSFLVNAAAIVPFVDLLYYLSFTRKKEAPKKGKIPEVDKMHDWKAGTPIGGGILIVALTTITYLLTILFSFKNWKNRSIYPFVDEVHILLLTFLGFALLGLYDDWTKIFGKPFKGKIGLKFGISGKTKFILQWALGFLIGAFLYFNLGLDFVHIPFTSVVIFMNWLFIPFAAFVIVSFSNAYNITDGLDGLSVGLLLIALVAFMTISSSNLDMPLSIFLAVWIGALIAFLYFNIYPARIMLGDAGALSFGATLGVIGLLTGKIFALVFIGGIFVVEVVSSLIQMTSLKLFNKKVFSLAPLHHTFETLGWPEPKIVMRAWLAGVILAIFGLWLALG